MVATIQHHGPMTTTHTALPARIPGASLSWQDRLDGAPAADEVVSIAREFVALISPEELAGLPAECRPRKIVDADDVVDYAVTLVRRSCASQSSSGALLQHMASFSTDACGRLSQLGRRPAPIARQ